MVLGITGGSGSGKSTVTNILKENYCINIIDGDIISREVISRKSIVDKLIQNFEEVILDENKNLNRDKLARIVFNDDKKLKILNEIMHKEIAFEIKKRISKDSQKTFVIDVALPVKVGFLDVCDEIWCVLANYETRINRLKQRDNLDEKSIYSRINSQPKDDYYIKISDKVLRNESSLEHLKYAVKVFWKEFVKG